MQRPRSRQRQSRRQAAHRRGRRNPAGYQRAPSPVNRRITATFLGLAAMCVAIAATDSQDEWVGLIQQAESRLRQHIRGENGPQEIYALLTEGTWGGLGRALRLGIQRPRCSPL